MIRNILIILFGLIFNLNLVQKAQDNRTIILRNLIKELVKNKMSYNSFEKKYMLNRENDKKTHELYEIAYKEILKSYKDKEIEKIKIVPFKDLSVKEQKEFNNESTKDIFVIKFQEETLQRFLLKNDKIVSFIVTEHLGELKFL